MINGNMDRNSEKIHVTKTFLPPIDEYNLYTKKIWENNQLTNQGPFLKEFEKKTRGYLKVNNFHFVANGTLALQLAIKSLDISEGEIITTPFSYVATTSAILWERCNPVFVDIDPQTLCIDPNKIEESITDKTKAILPVHVFGNPCDINAIDKIAKKHKLKVIYDGAHAFGVTHCGKSLLSCGDISTASFHATKPFHTIEGGGVVTNNQKISNRIELSKKFGHKGDEHFQLGINAKASEFQAAMGLCNLKYIDHTTEGRKRKAELYDKLLKNSSIQIVCSSTDGQHNYGYYPIILNSEVSLNEIVSRLRANNIFPRRYFYPSLNTLPYLKNKQETPISEDIAARILCLPLYSDLEDEAIKRICNIILK